MLLSCELCLKQLTFSGRVKEREAFERLRSLCFRESR